MRRKKNKDHVETENDAEMLLRNLRIYKALKGDRMIKYVAMDYGISETTARCAYNHILRLMLNDELEHELSVAKKLLFPCYERKPYIPQPCRTSSGARFTPL